MPSLNQMRNRTSPLVKIAAEMGVMFVSAALPSRTEYSPCPTAMGTALVGSLPLALVPSLLQKLTLPSPLTSTNLNWPMPLKLMPSTATRPWKLINWGTCARSGFSAAQQKATSSQRRIFICASSFPVG